MYYDGSHWTLIGNVAIPEEGLIVRRTGDGPDDTYVVNLRVLRSMGKGNEPEGWDVSVFGDQAINVARSLKQGDRVQCTGFPRLKRWTDRHGVPQITPEVYRAQVGGSFHFSGYTSHRNAATIPAQGIPANAGAPAPASNQNAASVSNDEDVPFVI